MGTDQAICTEPNDPNSGVLTGKFYMVSGSPDN